MHRPVRFSPALVVALLALFVALGGSAFAVNRAVRPVVRCGNGSVKGYAAVNLDTFAGAFPATFTGGRRIFTADYACSGSSPQARQLGHGIYEIRFPGVPARSAIVSGLSQNASSATWSPGAGTFIVRIVTPAGFPSDSGFAIAVF